MGFRFCSEDNFLSCDHGATATLSSSLFAPDSTMTKVLTSASTSTSMKDQEEVQEFQEWVHSLSWEQLLVSMEFAFSPDMSDSSSSQELELLKEMILLQAPPPTPIHPRALSFRPASAQSATDGRNDWARILSDRFHRPRLFQWLPQHTNTLSMSAASVANSGTNISRKLSSSRNAAWKRQRQQQPPIAVFHITARKFVGQDGTRYSLACTEEQLIQDEAILRGTSLVHPPDAPIVYGRFHSTQTTANSASMNTAANTNIHTRTDLLRMLHVASRGQFMTQSWRSKNPTSSSASSASSAIPYTAPWFHPTERWFSLPMYLASRFEVALWKSFGTDRASSSLPRPSVFPCSSGWRTSMERKLPADVINSAIGRSVADTLALQVLPEDASCVPRLRDSLLWNILLEYSGETASPFLAGLVGLRQDTLSTSLSHVLDGLLTCPLTQVGAPIDRLRRLVRQRLYLLLSQEMEQALLRELMAPDTDEINSNSANTSASMTNHVAASATKKKKNKKKRFQNKRKKSNRAPSTLSKVTESSLDVNEEDSSLEENSGASPSSDAFEPSTGSITCMDISFPDNGTNRRDRNRNTVLVLSILEDVMHEVHTQVGLESDPHSSTNSQVSDIIDQHEKEQERVSPDYEQINEVEQSHRSLQHENIDGAVWEPGEDAVFQHIDPSSTVDTLGYQSAMGDTPLNVNRTSLDVFSNHYGTHGGGFFYRSEPFDFTWGLTDAAMDDWGRIQGFASRDRSILTEFFPAVSSHHGHERVDDIIAEHIMACSTAASIASSSKGDDADSETVDKELESAFDPLSPVPASLDLTGKEVSIGEALIVPQERIAGMEVSASPQVGLARSISYSPELNISEEESENNDRRSPSPQAPLTPPPTLSPILVSLADLKRIQPNLSPLKLPSSSLPNSPNETMQPKLRTTRSREKCSQSSLPNSPNEIIKPKLRTSRSRERADGRGTRPTGQRLARSISELGRGLLSLRSVVPNPAKSTDDYDANGKAATVRRSMDALAPYRSPMHRHSLSRDDTDINKHVRVSATRPVVATAFNRNAATKASAQSVSSARTAGSGTSAKPFSHLHFDSAASKRTRVNNDICARSENSMTETDDSQQPNDIRRRHTNADEDAEIHAGTKDWETTSITSALSHREPEDVTALREERNTYRDMCLTLGAEVAKLKNMLAAQRGAALYQDLNYIQGVSQPIPDQHAFDPQAVSRFFKSTPRARTLAAMSDAGLRGEHESIASEDDKGGKADTLRHNSSGAIITDSDVSWDHASSHVRQLPPPTRDLHDPLSLNGTHSRLSKDILKFLDSTDMQLKKQNNKRLKAVERMTRLVKAVWPRAQVKLYGSHVTGLCVPSSDLDFVVCLPAVHKNAPAVAPGALEGRNAVNESSQRLLARRLKGESWIDPRSMKLIERTVVPVIKVATKDTKARTLQLDITFDSPGHHGLEAVEMVTQTMVELPMLRPLVLVLKQFLLDRCLLTAYTGGLSSYCLFLMVARYLQEQPSSWGDWGSLLMGFLDFYGNCVS